MKKKTNFIVSFILTLVFILSVFISSSNANDRQIVYTFGGENVNIYFTHVLLINLPDKDNVNQITNRYKIKIFTLFVKDFKYSTLLSKFSEQPELVKDIKNKIYFYSDRMTLNNARVSFEPNMRNGYYEVFIYYTF